MMTFGRKRTIENMEQQQPQKSPFLWSTNRDNHDSTTMDTRKAVKLLQNTLNPREMEKNLFFPREAFYINSMMRDRIKYPLSSQFSVKLPNFQDLTSLISVRMSHIVIPNAIYNVNNDNQFWFSEECSEANTLPTLFNAKVTPGIYTATELAAMLGDVMSTAKPYTNAVKVNASNDTVSTTNPENTYKFYYDRQREIMVVYSSSETRVPWRIHCPSINEQASIHGNNLGTKKNQVPITSFSVVSVNAPYTRIRVNTGVSRHNITYNGSFTVSLKSQTGKSYFKSNMTIYGGSYDDGVIGTNYLEFNVLTTDWTFSSDDLVASNLKGWITSVVSENSIWPMLGYIYTQEETYTPIPILNARNRTDTTNARFYCNRSLPFVTNDEVYLSNVTVSNGTAPYTVTNGGFSTVDHHELSMFEISKDDITLSTVDLPSNASVYRIGGYVADQCVDMRGPTNIYIRLALDNIYVGRGKIVTNYIPLELEDGSHPDVGTYFSVVNITRVNFGETMEGSRLIDDLGDYITPSLGNKLPNSVTFELLDVKGRLINLQNLDWNCVLYFQGKRIQE